MALRPSAGEAGPGLGNAMEPRPCWQQPARDGGDAEVRHAERALDSVAAVGDDRLNPALRQIMRESVLGDRMDEALLFKVLATLHRDAPLFDDVAQLRWGEPTERFAAWAKRMDAQRLLERCLAIQGCRWKAS